MKESELRNRSKQFALLIVAACEKIDGRKGRDVLVRQIMRSGTSIGANIHEANYASSKADFINKLHIAAKECIETEYWLEIMEEARLIGEDTASELKQACGIIHKMLAKSLNTAKINAK